MLELRFHYVEPRSQVAGVGEGLEGSELFFSDVVGAAFHFQEPGSGDIGDEAALRLEPDDLAADRVDIVGEAGEIDVGGDVDLAGGIEGVLASAVT